jgi:hypothetical protein
MTESEAAVGGKRVCNICINLTCSHDCRWCNRFRVCIGTRDVINFRLRAKPRARSANDPAPAAARPRECSILRCARGRRRQGFAACLVLAGAIGLSVATENCISVRFSFTDGSAVAPRRPRRRAPRAPRVEAVGRRTRRRQDSRSTRKFSFRSKFQRTPRKILLYLREYSNRTDTR